MSNFNSSETPCKRRKWKVATDISIYQPNIDGSTFILEKSVQKVEQDTIILGKSTENSKNLPKVCLEKETTFIDLTLCEDENEENKENTENTFINSTPFVSATNANKPFDRRLADISHVSITPDQNTTILAKNISNHQIDLTCNLKFTPPNSNALNIFPKSSSPKRRLRNINKPVLQHFRNKNVLNNMNSQVPEIVLNTFGTYAANTVNSRVARNPTNVTNKNSTNTAIRESNSLDIEIFKDESNSNTIPSSKSTSFDILSKNQETEIPDNKSKIRLCAEKRRRLNKRYTLVVPSKNLLGTEPVKIQGRIDDPYALDPYSEEQATDALSFIESNVKQYLNKGLLPVIWDKKLKGKKSLAKLRHNFRRLFTDTVQPGLSLLYNELKENKIALRDYAILKDVGKMNLLAKYWVETINPLWLTCSIEAILNSCFPIKAFEDDIYRKRVLKTSFFYSKSSNILKDNTKKTKQKAEYTFLRRCFELFQLLNTAKCSRIIDEDPPLFKRESKIPGGTKSMLNFVTEWSTQFLGKEGSIKRHLSRLNYELIYEQKALHEIDLKINDLAIDLKDGVRIAKLFEILDEQVDVLSYVRFNPGAKSQIPKMSREYNWSLNLKVCMKLKIDASFCFNDELNRCFSKSELSLGHREQTLLFCLRLMRFYRDKFTYPSLEILEKLEIFADIFLLKSPEKIEIHKKKLQNIKIISATKIQKWWRNLQIQKYNKPEIIKAINILQKNFKILVAKRELNIKRQNKLENDAISCIQKSVRMFLAKKRVFKLKLEKERIENEKKRKIVEFNASLVIQSSFRMFLAKKTLLKLKLEKARIENEKKRKILEFNAILVIQSSVRMFLAKRTFLKLKLEKARIENEKKQKALELSSAILLQRNIKIFLRKTRLKRIKSAEIINKTVRMFLAKKKVEKIKITRNREKSAILIQTRFRMVLATKHVEKLREEKKQLNASIVLQKYFRGFIAKKVVKKLRNDKKEQQILEDKSATVLQKNYKMVVARNKYFILLENHKKAVIESKKLKCALVMQCYYRRTKAIKVFENKKLELKSVIIIQSSVRVFLAKIKLNNLRKAKKLEIQKRNSAILTIQSYFKVFQAKKLLEKLKVLKKIEERNRNLIKCAIIMQCYYRRTQAKKIYNVKLLEKRRQLLIKKNTAATKITYFFKIFLAKKKLNQLKQNKIKKQEKAAVYIQKCFKGYIAKKKYKKLVILDKARKLRILEDEAATVIQKYSKGYLVRKKLSERLNERRKDLRKLKSIEDSLAYMTNISLIDLKNNHSTGKIKKGLEQLIRSINLLPEIQSKIILFNKGLLYIGYFLRISTKTPAHIELVNYCYKTIVSLFPYIKEEKDRSDALELIKYNIQESIQLKFAYKLRENTQLLLVSLKLQILARKTNWSKHAILLTKLQENKFIELVNSNNYILNNIDKYSMKQLWISNAKLLEKSLSEYRKLLSTD